MMAVLDTTRNGWALVGKIHRMGFAVSWVVGDGVEVGFEALPMGFRGVVHRVGFEDRSQVATAVRGCEEVIVLVEGGAGGRNSEGERALAVARSVVGSGVPLYLAVREGENFEVRKVEVEEREGARRRVKVEPVLAGHVG